MTSEEFDTALRAQLRELAQDAPPGAPVRARVLTSTRASAAAGRPARNLKAWRFPIQLAAAVLVVILGVGAGWKLLSLPGRPYDNDAAGAGLNGGSSIGGPSYPAPWYVGLDFDKLPHTPGMCPGKLTLGPIGRPTAEQVSVPGEPKPLWLLPVTCAGPAGTFGPQVVEVFRQYRTGAQLVQTLGYRPGDRRPVAVTSIGIGGTGDLVLGGLAYAPTDRPCCRSLRFTQAFSWQKDLGRYVAGPRQAR